MSDDIRTASGQSRRRFLKWANRAMVGTAGAALLPAAASAQRREGTRVLGGEVGALGERSPFATAARRYGNSRFGQASSSRTPLQDLRGTITPSDLHFERHHAGIPEIDPSTHELLIDGLVDQPLVFSMGALERMPATTRTYFIECSGNGRAHWAAAQSEADAQALCGMTSCSEWTGVPLSALLEEAGVQAEAAWLVGEGADACRLTRSIPLDKAMDDALVAFAQNGEALRPAQGYPIRLVIPGWEGNISVKWLRRIHVVDRPYQTREETSKYTDLMPDGTARQFTFDMEPKSIITRPSGGQRLEQPGFHQITGLAWSGRGKIRRVEVTTDGGDSWAEATLQTPVLSIAHTRFRFDWTWDGSETTLASRCIDETGYVQPSRAALIGARGTRTNYHYNGVQAWRVTSNGAVENVDV